MTPRLLACLMLCLCLRLHAELPETPTRNLRFDTGTGTWLSLDLSPDGQTIVFDLLGDLYTMDARGGEARCIACGLAFDSQPTFSPDGRQLAFLSDRSGNENLWVASPDGTSARALSTLEDNTVFVSPAWSADGTSIYVTRFQPDLNAFELWRYPVAGGAPEQITHAKSAPDTPKEFRANALGAVASRDGRYLYYAEKTGLGFDDDLSFPLWHIARRDLRSGIEETVVDAAGSAFRPALSPDGTLLAYATRIHGQTGLRLRNLADGTDRLLAYPVQHDEQEASASRDLLPRYAFTADSQAVVAAYEGHLHRIALTGKTTVLPFLAHVDLPTGATPRPHLAQDTGPVRARLLQTPSLSPDGQTLVFSALGHIYLQRSGEQPMRLTGDSTPEFMPAWSPDGHSVVYVTWTASSGGAVWRLTPGGQPTRLTADSAFYTNPVFTPDGRNLVALRSSNYDHLHRTMELGPIESDAVLLDADRAAPVRAFTSGLLAGVEPQFTAEPGQVYLNFADGLYRVALDGSSRQRIVQASGPTYYFMEGLAPADAIKIGPDGRHALVQITQQLYLLALPTVPAAIDLTQPSPNLTRLTSIGADFFGWADSGRSITWSVGATFFRQPLASIAQGSIAPPLTADDSRPNVTATRIAVSLPRDTPQGNLLLRGATAITMQDDRILPDADLLIADDRIAAIGPRGSFPIPAGTTVRDVSGKWLLPGFTDTHMHWADVRRGVLDLTGWGFRATLAYGITSALDPSPLSIDMLAYQDLLDAGAMIGTRVFSTGPAVFSFNRLDSLAQTELLLRRYRDFYRTGNLKQYRTGNRRQREWVRIASEKLGLLTTCEGALDFKLDLTQIQDGFPGNEHAFSAVPLQEDIVQLAVQTGVSYTPTLQISNGGLPAQQFFYAAHPPADDPKLRHFTPPDFLEHKLSRLRWAAPQEYLYPQVAHDAATLARAGGLVGVGSHGELPGYGYHLELQALAAGGMAPLEVLRAATLGSSRTIGRDRQFGSLEAGKFADLLILNRDPLMAIENTLALDAVMKNGRLYNADTLDQQWPNPETMSPFWFAGEPLAGTR